MIGKSGASDGGVDWRRDTMQGQMGVEAVARSKRKSVKQNVDRTKPSMLHLQAWRLFAFAYAVAAESLKIHTRTILLDMKAVVDQVVMVRSSDIDDDEFVTFAMAEWPVLSHSPSEVLDSHERKITNCSFSGCRVQYSLVRAKLSGSRGAICFWAKL